MREPTGPQSNGTGPDDRRPPRHSADDLAQLESVLQQLRQMLEAHDAAPRWVPLQVTHEAVALAHRLLHGWQVQQAMTQGWLTRWQQTLQTLETVGVALQSQAETHQAQTVQLRRAPWWALLAGGVPDGPGGRVVGGTAHRPTALRRARVADTPACPQRAGDRAAVRQAPSAAPDATLTSEAHDTPIRDGP
jgi:hypothetical protein